MAQSSNDMTDGFPDPGGDAQPPLLRPDDDPAMHPREELPAPLDAPDDSTPTAASECAEPLVGPIGSQGTPDASDASEAPDDATQSDSTAAPEADSPPAQGDSPSPEAEANPIASEPDDANSPPTEYEVWPLGKVELLKGTDGRAYLIDRSLPNPLACRIGSAMGNNLINALAMKQDAPLTQNKLKDLNARLSALALTARFTKAVWYRVAPIEGG